MCPFSVSVKAGNEKTGATSLCACKKRLLFWRVKPQNIPKVKEKISRGLSCLTIISMFTSRPWTKGSVVTTRLNKPVVNYLNYFIIYNRFANLRKVEKTLQQRLSSRIRYRRLEINLSICISYKKKTGIHRLNRKKSLQNCKCLTDYLLIW